MELFKKELTLVELLALSWGIYCHKFKTILAISLIIYIPANIVRYLFILFFNQMNTYVFLLSYFFDFLLISIAILGITVITESAVNEQKYDGILDWRKTISLALDSWDKCVFANTLAGVLAIFLSFLLIIPGIIWSIYCVFITPAVALRDIAGKEAISYSVYLVKGNWWKVFSVSVLIFIVTLIPSFAASLMPYSAGFIFDICADVALAFFSVAITVLFLNLELVKTDH